MKNTQTLFENIVTSVFKAIKELVNELNYFHNDIFLANFLCKIYHNNVTNF
jgi:hypothetical protein